MNQPSVATIINAGLAQNQKAFLNEGSVRKFIGNLFEPNIYWVEQAPGSTFGFADCMIAWNGTLTLVELKLGHMVKNDLRFVVRPAQRHFARGLATQGIHLMWLVGVRGTRAAHWLPTNPATLAGCVRLAVGRYALPPAPPGTPTR